MSNKATQQPTFAVQQWRVLQVGAVAAGLALLLTLILNPELGVRLFWNLLIPVVPVIALLFPGWWRNTCARWRAFGATYSTDLLFDTQGALDFQVTGRSSFVVVEDKQKSIRDSGKYQLLSWIDLDARRETSSIEGVVWGQVKALYLP